MRLFILSLVLLCCFAVPCTAEELPEYQPYLPDAVTKNLNAEWLSAFGLAEGERGALLSTISNIFRLQLADALKGASLLFGMLIMVALCAQYSQTVARPLATNTVQLASMLCMALTTYTMLQALWQSVGQALGSMQTILAAMAPTITALSLAGGNTAASGVYGVGVTWLVAGMEAILGHLLFPAMHVCYTMILIGGVATETPIDELGKWIRKLLVGILGTGMAVLAFVLTVQGTIAQSADSVTAKTMKFAIGNLVPFVGAAVGESVRTLSAAMGYLRSSVGVSAVVALCALLLPTLLNLVFYKGIFSIIGQLAGVVGCKAEGKLLCGVSDILSIALAILISCFLCSVMILALFAKTAVAFS